MSQPNEYHLVAFDPGGTIGWAHLVVNFKAFESPEAKVLRYLEHWDCGEFTGTEHEQLKLAVSLIRETRDDVRDLTDSGHKSKADIIGENFELTQLVGGAQLLSPVRINAVLTWECAKLGLPYHLQARQMRTSVTKERLRLFGFKGKWTTTGEGKDAFAAMQHAVTWLRRVKQKSRSQPWNVT